MPAPVSNQRPFPTRFQAAAFVVKASLFRWRRHLQELAKDPLPRFPQVPIPADTSILAESRSALFSSTQAAEFSLQAGKVHNLRVAAAQLNGLRIPAGSVFGFWAHVPRPTRSRGFVHGRELREGCIIPSVGGGLCQLSNALYDAALVAGFEIVERHAHSRLIPGSMAAVGRDATVFWNYVDLRFRPATECQLEILLTRHELIIRFHGTNPAGLSAPATASIQFPPAPPEAESCETCGVTDCFRHLETGTLATHGHAAWLLDAFWPEYDRYLTDHRLPADWLFTPLDRRRWKIGPYRWDSTGFAKVHSAPFEVARRSFISRRLAAQGAARQRALLRFDEALAQCYARRLPPEATHLVVSQNLLPWLWRAGVLGGRTFDVMMTRLPIGALQTALDRARLRHPESPTLADFRADARLLDDETAALAEASHWITPHAVIAKLAGSRAIKLDWHLPAPDSARRGGKEIVFPASTLGRKGAYEMRAVARELGLHLRLGGPIMEDTAFWEHVAASPANASWLDDAGIVVLPAYVEHQPRRLLQAVAAGVPVLASEACGLAGVANVTTIREGDPAAIIAALADFRSSRN